MEYLLDYGFSNTLIEELNSFYDIAIIELLECNEENVKKVIELFESKNIKNIEDLLFMDIDVFFKNYEELEEKLNNNPELIDKINMNAENIYEL